MGCSFVCFRKLILLLRIRVAELRRQPVVTTAESHGRRLQWTRRSVVGLVDVDRFLAKESLVSAPKHFELSVAD
jgi:hypothetical protein